MRDVASNDFRKSECGQSLILVAFSLVVLCGFMGLAIDVGRLRAEAIKLQTAADAAALAGALEINYCNGTASCTAMQDSAKAAVGENGLTVSSFVTACPGKPGTGVTLMLFNGPCYLGTTDPNHGNARYVETVVANQVPWAFASVFGLPPVTLTARSEAALGLPQFCVYALDPSAQKTISFTGGASLNASCGVMDDSSSKQALALSGSSEVDATAVWVHGDVSNSGTINPAPVTGVPALSDPLASLPQPTPASCSSQPDPKSVANSIYYGAKSAISISAGTNATFNPGTYCGGITLSGSSSAKFEPGLYIIEGNVTFSGGDTVTVDTTKPDPGVTIYLYSGQWSMTGSNTVNLIAPTSGTYSGILFFQNPNDTNSFTVSGGASSVWQGTIYIPGAPISLTGGANVAAYTILIAKQISGTGNSVFNVGADYSSLPDGPPIHSKTSVLVQ